MGFTHILEACRHAQVAHLVFASTSSVYGANTTMPFSEAQGVDHPLQFYAATKRANELMAHAYAHLYALPCTGLRFFTVYGPWGRPDMAPMIFATAIAEGRPIELFNEGRHSRDFTYVDDIVEGVIRASDRPALPDPDWDPADPDPGHLERAVPPLQHRQRRAGRARRLHRRARARARPPGDPRARCRCSPATCPTPGPTRAGSPARSTGARPRRSTRGCAASSPGSATTGRPRTRLSLAGPADPRQEGISAIATPSRTHGIAIRQSTGAAGAARPRNAPQRHLGHSRPAGEAGRAHGAEPDPGRHAQRPGLLGTGAARQPAQPTVGRGRQRLERLGPARP